VGVVDARLLQALPYFQELSPAELVPIAGHVHQRNLEAGEVIYLAGQPAEALYAVHRGRVRIFESSAEGKEQVLFVVGRGATFNDAAVFDGGPNIASAQTIEPGAGICVLPLPMMVRLVATNPRVAAAAIRIMTGRVRSLAALVEDLSLQHLTQRVAKTLLRESTPLGVVMLTKQEIATRVGTVREVVSRELRQLEQEGAILRGRDGTVQIDRRALSALLVRPMVEAGELEDQLSRRAAS
jgi:CRP/FNR family transcriptional regulator, cyclic AMP receptor protein